jgi:hypothetical protein
VFRPFEQIYVLLKYVLLKDVLLKTRSHSSGPAVVEASALSVALQPIGALAGTGARRIAELRDALSDERSREFEKKYKRGLWR